MAVQRNILHDSPTPWRVTNGRVLQHHPVIEDARGNLVASLAIGVPASVAQQICDAINGPSRLDDYHQYQERGSGGSHA